MNDVIPRSIFPPQPKLELNSLPPLPDIAPNKVMISSLPKTTSKKPVVSLHKNSEPVPSLAFSKS